MKIWWDNNARLSLFVFFMCLAGWVNWGLWTRSPDLTSLPVERSPEVIGTGINQPAESTPIDETVLQTYARPLFEPSRIPYEAPIIDPIVLPDVQEDKLPNEEIDVISEVPAFRILGIQRTPGRSQALVQLNGEGGPNWYSEADVVAGWTLKEIAAGHLIFTLNQREYVAELYPKDNYSDGLY